MIARTSPPAKLNLFLEIPARRDDGYHQIDTVMVAINWRDELSVQSIDAPEVQFSTRWLPSLASVAAELGLPDQHHPNPDDPAYALLQIPCDETNLVTRALQCFRAKFGIESGFRAELGKRIPAGAGMGGASSDAAHAISCAAQIHQVTDQMDLLREIAASIGSDVPFFLPTSGLPSPARAAWARGRGETVTPIGMRTDIHCVVAFPAHSMSTGGVYRRLNIPKNPRDSAGFRRALVDGDVAAMAASMMNRLSEPALEILPPLGELLESLWQSGLEPCQLTGSGSACFGLARDAEHADAVTRALKKSMQPGVLIQAASTVTAAATIEIESS